MGEENALLYSRIPINKDRLVELENQFLAVTIVTIISGRHHQWLIKPEDEKKKKNQKMKV